MNSHLRLHMFGMFTSLTQYRRHCTSTCRLTRVSKLVNPDDLLTGRYLRDKRILARFSKASGGGTLYVTSRYEVSVSTRRSFVLAANTRSLSSSQRELGMMRYPLSYLNPRRQLRRIVFTVNVRQRGIPTAFPWKRSNDAADGISGRIGRQCKEHGGQKGSLCLANAGRNARGRGRGTKRANRAKERKRAAD